MWRHLAQIVGVAAYLHVLAWIVKQDGVSQFKPPWLMHSLRDALTLVEEIAAHGLDAALIPEAYAARRREDRERTLAFSDGLARASSNDALAMRGLRSLGMAALANVPGLRAQVAAGGMGYRGDVPALCREAAR